MIIDATTLYKELYATETSIKLFFMANELIEKYILTLGTVNSDSKRDYEIPSGDILITS